MDPNPNIKRSFLQSETRTKVNPDYPTKLQRIEAFFRYRMASIYRQLQVPIYTCPEQQKRRIGGSLEHNKTLGRRQSWKDTQGKLGQVGQMVDILFKSVSLNSKYRHREKMRFGRTPLLKHLEYDLNKLFDKIKSKEHQKTYDDLKDSEAEDEEQEIKYTKDPHFSESSLANYKRKHCINGRICVVKGYEDLKERLISAHGWSENDDIRSLMFDLKFVSKKKNIDYMNLLEGQVVNHYEDNKAVTAKFGLTRNILNIVALGKDHSYFFPRCYDVNDVAELENFYQDFKLSRSKTILIEIVKKEKQYCPQLIDFVLHLLERDLLNVQQKMETIAKNTPLYISKKEWAQLQQLARAPIEQSQSDNGQMDKLMQRASILYTRFWQTDPQFSLNKDNIWIVKPASMSRGRGIKTFNQLNEILDYVIAKEISWVVQKYIERPLIIRRKKFDIRQWVLWTDFKPMRVWAYEECYVRFCSQIYCPQDLKNRNVHLTNNSVTKGINNVDDGIEENMMSQGTFAKELEQLEGKEIFQSVLKPQIDKIALETLQSVIQNVQSRRNTFELFGYDFMVDEEYKVWLIEVNSSPTMEHSTKVTTDLVRRGLSDLADLVNHYYFGAKHVFNSPSYGGWKLIQH